MTINNQTPIASFSALVSKLKEQKAQLESKQKKSYWKRYIIRRLPLVSISFLIFFASFFSMGLVKEIGFQAVNSSLATLAVVPDINFLWILTTPIIIQFILIPERLDKINKKTLALNKIGFIICIFSFFSFLAMLIMKMEFAVQLGFPIFTLFTILPLLFDRTLGWTRQNNRFGLFSCKLQGLIELNATREKLSIEFSEHNVLEYLKVIDDFNNSKYNDTISDSFYLLHQAEKLKS
jgi:hypothetical protein